MSQPSGVAGYVKQDRPNGVGAQAAYFIEESPGVYVPAVGKKSIEADAWLMEESAGVFVLADSSADEDRAPYLVDSTTVLI